jgi:hypothetical protein
MDVVNVNHACIYEEISKHSRNFIDSFIHIPVGGYPFSLPIVIEQSVPK